MKRRRKLGRGWLIGCAVSGVCLVTLSASATVQADTPESPASIATHPVLAGPLEKVAFPFELSDGASPMGRRLFVPDVKAGKLFVLDTSDFSAQPRVRLGGPVKISGTASTQGRLILSDNGNYRIAVLGSKGRPETLAEFSEKERPNDVSVDSRGNIYVTLTRTGRVARVDRDGNILTVAEDLVAPNGIGVSPDDQSLYVSSHREGWIYRMDLGGDFPTVAEKWARLPETDDGYRGDGMTIDRGGWVYVTGANAVHVFDTTGQSVTEIPVSARPINVSFADPNQQTLTISTFGGVFGAPAKRIGIEPTPELPMTLAETNKTLPFPPLTPEDVQADLNVVYHTVETNRGPRKLLADVFRTGAKEIASQAAQPGIILVHGGGWLKGDKKRFRKLAVRLARRGYVVAVIEYRLGVEAAFPAGIQDCNAATAYFREHADDYGIDPKRLAAVGGSAGGHLVGLMAAAPNRPDLRHGDEASLQDASLQAAVVIAGPLQIVSGSVGDRGKADPKSNVWRWMHGSSKAKPELHRAADAYEAIDASTPPMQFISGSRDNPERNQASREKLKSLGIATELVVHPDAKHAHWHQAKWVDRVTDDIDGFLQKHLK